MKFICSAVFYFVLLFCSYGAMAQDAAMIIRFNNDVVSYQQPLEKVVDAALNAKANVFFDVVAVVPETGSTRNDRTNKAMSVAYSNDVVEVLRRSGIGPDNIRITYQNSELVKNSEVHIFVR